MKSRTFHKKLPLFIEYYPPFIENYWWPPYRKLQPLISAFIKKTQFSEIIETPAPWRNVNLGTRNVSNLGVENVLGWSEQIPLQLCILNLLIKICQLRLFCKIWSSFYRFSWEWMYGFSRGGVTRSKVLTKVGRQGGTGTEILSAWNTAVHNWSEVQWLMHP